MYRTTCAGNGKLPAELRLAVEKESLIKNILRV